MAQIPRSQKMQLRGVGYRCFSRQFGRTSAPMVPHFVQTIFGSNDFTVRSPGQ